MNVPQRRPAFGYLRRSKEDETGNSMAAQEKAIREKFEPLGFQFIAWFRDEHSAFRNSAKRDGLSKLLKALDDHPEVRDVAVEQFDRLDRDLDHVGWIRTELKNRLVRVHYVLNDYDLTTPDGVIMTSVNAGIAASHSMQNAQKTHSRMKANFQQRDPETGWLLKNGGRPQYGYKIVQVKHWVNHNNNWKRKHRSVWDIDEVTSKIFRRIVIDMRIGSNMSYEEIRDTLNAEGIISPEGKLWTKSTVHEVLREDRLIVATGKAVWNRENPKDPILRYEQGKFKPKDEWLWVENAHPAILTPEEAEAAIAVNQRRGPKTYTPRTDASPYLFSGPNSEGELMFVCKRCGGAMVSYQKTKGKSFYACTHANNEGPHGSCGPIVKVSKEFLENEVVETILARYNSDLFISEVLSQVNAIIDDLNANGSHELKTIDNAISLQSKRVKNLLNAIQMNGASQILMESFKEAEVELQSLQQKRVFLSEDVKHIDPIDENQLRQLLDNMTSVMNSGTNKQRREMIRAFVSRITFDPENRKIDVFFWPSPLMGPDHYIKKAKHIFQCFARLDDIRNFDGIRISDGGGEPSRTRVPSYSIL